MELSSVKAKVKLVRGNLDTVIKPTFIFMIL